MSLDISLHFEVDTGGADVHDFILHSDSISHNVSLMWKKAGVRDILYNGDGLQAGILIDNLSSGVEYMSDYPDQFILSPHEGYGEDYDTALTFLSNLLEACRSHPNAEVHVSK